MTGGIPQDDLSHLEIAEGSRARITGTLKDDTDAVIALADLDTLELTLYNEVDGTVINSRSALNVLNLNGGTVHTTSGALTMLLTPADNVIVSTAAPPAEVHIALFKFTYLGNADNVGYWRVRLAVANLLKVT